MELFRVEFWRFKKNQPSLSFLKTPRSAIGECRSGRQKKKWGTGNWVQIICQKIDPFIFGCRTIDDIIDLWNTGLILLIASNRQIGEWVDISNFKKQSDRYYKNNYKKQFRKTRHWTAIATSVKILPNHIYTLFKQREILGYTLATFHNLWGNGKVIR